MILLCGAAVLSIVLNTATASPEHRSTAWIEGFSILMAVAIVVFVTATNDFQKEKQFRKLNEKKDDHLTKVIRNGVPLNISVHDVVVGDLVHLETGDILGADGILVEGHNIKIDESSTNGESDAVKKSAEVDPFFLSGTQVLEGLGTMIVINVGPNSYEGKTMMSLRVEAESTPLEEKLDDLADSIGKLGLAAAVFVVVILIIKHLFIMHRDKQSFGIDDVQRLVSYLVVAITIVVVAVPEGLPLSVTIALAYSMIKMIDDQNLVRVLSACETMGSATMICSDKTGTLTQNKMTVVRGQLGEVDFEGTNFKGEGIVEIAKVLFSEGADINSTAAESTSADGKLVFLGSKTETALLQFSRRLGGDYVATRKELSVIKLYPFSSALKRMSTVIQLAEGYRMHVKGASEVILALCQFYVSRSGKVQPMTPELRAKFDALITSYAQRGLRTISMAYCDIPRARDWDADVPKDPLILISIVGIQDPVRPEVPTAVRDCQNAGIMVRMVTGDNAITAAHIAKECGIYDPSAGGRVMEGPVFRNLSDEELDECIPHLQVLARSSPLDKQILVQKLKAMGEIVAVTGDGTNDAPALKMANIGFSMGIAGTEVAKEASQIILMDDNFASIVKAVMWGRNVFDSIRKFLQFQLTVNVVAVSVAIIGSVTSSKGESPLKPVQLLWVNLIMDTLAALALATEEPTRALLDRLPNGKHAPLITRVMWIHVLGQAAYQLVVTLAILYRGHIIFNLPEGSIAITTILFNTFVFCQLFNEINCRKINQELNVFSGITKNKVFLGVMFTTLIIQVAFIQLGGSFSGTTKLDLYQWVACIVIGAVGLPLGFILRLLPTSWDSSDKLEERALDAELEAEAEGLLAIREKTRHAGVDAGGSGPATTAPSGAALLSVAGATYGSPSSRRASITAVAPGIIVVNADGADAGGEPGMRPSPSVEFRLAQGGATRSRSTSISNIRSVDAAGIVTQTLESSQRARRNWSNVVRKINHQRNVVRIFESIHRPTEARRHPDNLPPVARFNKAVDNIRTQHRVVSAFRTAPEKQKE
jgi:Ca2+-transporting ATPase